MEHSGRGRRLMGLLLGIALTVTGPGRAQEVQPPAPEPPAVEPGLDPIADNEPELEEVIITANKQKENLQAASLSVAAIDGDKLDDLRSGGQDIGVLSSRVPSLTIESSFGRTFPRAYIRGLGNTDFDLNASQPVSIVLDEIVLENPVTKGFPLFDLERVEVLRGPQGTLFGRNTPAGVIKFESRKPTMGSGGYGRLTYGQFNFLGLEGVANAPLIDGKLAARVSLMYERQDGWVDNSFAKKEDALEGFEDVAGRFQLLFIPSDWLVAHLNVHAHSLDGTARVFRANILKPGTGEFAADFKRGFVAQDGQNEQHVQQLGSVLNLQLNLGRLTLTSVSGYEGAEVYSRGDIDGGYGAAFAPPSGPGVIPFPSETADGIPKLHQLSQELRLASDNWERVNFQAGFFYFYEDLDIESFSYDTLAGGVQNGYARQNQKSYALGLFAYLRYEVLTDLRLSGGLRYSNDKKDFVARRLVSPIGSGPLAPVYAHPEDDFLSWNASATYDLTPEVMLFANGASGFRAPSIQGRVLFGDLLSVADSERILSFDAGVKTELFGRRARINAAGFFYQLADQQLTAVGGEANFNTLLNADKTIGYGFEADMEFLPLAELLITLGVSFNHTEILDENLAVAPCAGGCTVLDSPGAVDGTVLIGGNPLPNAPAWIANLTARYSFPVVSGEWFAFTDWALRSRVHFFLYHSKEFTDAWMLIGSLRLGYLSLDKRMEVAAFVHNVTDDVSLAGSIDFNNLTGFVNEPRVWGLEAIFRY